jgi:hypothetical protein
MGAPVAEMETVVITRGWKVLACLFGLMSFLLLITTTGGTAWVLEGNDDPYTAHGLFENCEVKNVPLERQERDGTEEFVCKPPVDVPTWLLACQALMIVAVVVAFVSFVVIAVGLCSSVEGCKFGAYRAGIYGYFICILCIIVTCVVYPIKFFQDNAGEHLTLGWAYGLAWGLAVLLLAGALMLILDKGEELMEREKMPDEEEDA